jgi:peptidyl-prolyl cis-trans isomerase C
VLRVLAFILVLGLAACSKGPGTKGTGTSAPQSDPAPASPTPAATPAVSVGSGGQAGAPAREPVPAQLPAVMARVNGEEISKSDFEKAVGNIERREGGSVPATERDRIFRGVLDELIGYRLLLQESRNRKVAVPDAEVDAHVGQIRQRFQTEDAFKTMLTQEKLTIEQVRAETRNELSVSKLLEAEIVPKIAVTPEEVSAFFKGNPQQFQVPEQVRASHILITVPPNADASVKAAALEKVTTILKSARGGKDFAALAKEHSQDPGSAANGGDLDFFQSGQMVGPFNDVAFKLPTGSISDVVETQFGYHIIKVTDKRPPRAVTLDEVRPRIEQYLKSVNQQKHTQAFVQSLRTKGKVDVFI